MSLHGTLIEKLFDCNVKVSQIEEKIKKKLSANYDKVKKDLQKSKKDNTYTVINLEETQAEI